MATELLYFPVNIPASDADVIYPLGVIPRQHSGTRMARMTYYLRAKSAEGTDLWIMDVGTLDPAGTYSPLSATRGLTEGRGVHVWEESVDFPSDLVPAVRFRQQGFPVMLEAMTVIPHFRIRGGRDAQTR